MKTKKKYPAKLSDSGMSLILHACKDAGEYSQDALCMVEEQFLLKEGQAIFDFVEWVSQDVDNRKFGHSNIRQRYQEFLANV